MGTLERLYAHDTQAVAERERLRGLLTIARKALVAAGEAGLVYGVPARFHAAILDALRLSDPDAVPGGAPNAD